MVTFSSCVFIEPHERGEAIEAYKDRLTQLQIDDIEAAEASALICLSLKPDKSVVMTIIPEG